MLQLSEELRYWILLKSFRAKRFLCRVLGHSYRSEFRRNCQRCGRARPDTVLGVQEKILVELRAIRTAIEKQAGIGEVSMAQDPRERPAD
jgi:hypothetical protein